MQKKLKQGFEVTLSSRNGTQNLPQRRPDTDQPCLSLSMVNYDA